ncbi:MAG: HAD family hydrolase [Elusimicrobia bacterium]|nr:HAD family hydrolase [Elusimicrobiota bacterium]
MMFKIIFCDVDGTLTGHKTKPVDSAIRSSIIKLREQGIKFGTATSHVIDGKFTKKFSKYYKLDFMVLENGAVIYLRQKDGSYKKLMCYERENKEKWQHLSGLKKYFFKIAKRIKTSDPVLTDNNYYKIYCLGKTYLKIRSKTSLDIILVNPKDSMAPIIKILKKECHKNKWKLSFVKLQDYFIQIGIANKSDGVKYLSNYLGIPLKDVCAIGDAENDIEMLKSVGLPACPSDVTQELEDIVEKKHGIVATREVYFGIRQILSKLCKEI